MFHIFNIFVYYIDPAHVAMTLAGIFLCPPEGICPKTGNRLL